ncbi:hypothetical protein [Nonomuraea rubra]|uniref:hypothetical protein n=1 Tax=Nonomuraea rubra TaxID=46180 RepID=UPI0033FB87E6
MTWRRLDVLLRNLPPESRLKTALRNEVPDQELRRMSEGADPSTGQWSHAEMLQALVIDALREIRYVLVKVNGGKAKPPDPLPRPGVKARRKGRRHLTPQQQEAVFRRIDGGSLSGAWQHSEPGKVTHLPRNS